MKYRSTAAGPFLDPFWTDSRRPRSKPLGRRKKGSQNGPTPPKRGAGVAGQLPKSCFNAPFGTTWTTSVTHANCSWSFGPSQKVQGGDQTRSRTKSTTIETCLTMLELTKDQTRSNTCPDKVKQSTKSSPMLGHLCQGQKTHTHNFWAVGRNIPTTIVPKRSNKCCASGRGCFRSHA